MERIGLNMESKYKLKQEVWVMHNNRPHRDKIRRIQQTKSIETEYPVVNGLVSIQEYPDPIEVEVIETQYEIFNGNVLIFLNENQLFPTKEELIKSL